MLKEEEHECWHRVQDLAQSKLKALAALQAAMRSGTLWRQHRTGTECATATQLPQARRREALHWA